MIFNDSSEHLSNLYQSGSFHAGFAHSATTLCSPAQRVELCSKVAQARLEMRILKG
jgi:hypothetical protein